MEMQSSKAKKNAEHEKQFVKNLPFSQSQSRPQPNVRDSPVQDGSYLMPLKDNRRNGYQPISSRNSPVIGSRSQSHSPAMRSPPSGRSSGQNSLPSSPPMGRRSSSYQQLQRSNSNQQIRRSSSRDYMKSPGSPQSASPNPTLLKKRRETKERAVPSSPEKNATTVDKSASLLGWFFLGMVAIGSLNKIYSKLQCYPMHDYPIFLSLVGTGAYVPLCFAYIFPVAHFRNDWITPEQKAIPKYKFFIMGLFDSLSSTAQTFAVNYITNASLIILIQQSAIPISMIISAIFLHARYTTYQYLGATVVMAGIIVCVLPSLSSLGSDGDGSSEAIWMGVLVLSCIPMCLSSVYKEKALGEVDMDVVYLNGWVAWYQLWVTLCLAIPSAWSMGYSISEIPQNIMDGFTCYLGSQPADRLAEEGLDAYYSCSESMVLVNMYIFFNVGYNILLILILKYGSANILWLASTVMVPFGNIVFSFKFVPGHQPLTSSNFWSLGLIMGGLILYRFYGNLVTWLKQRKKTIPKELQETERQQREIVHHATQKMKNFVGINQAEFLEPMVDARIYEDQKAMLYRTNVQIRGSFLARLGLPPSPGLTSTPRTRRNLRNQKRVQNSTSEKSPLMFNNKRYPQRTYAIDV